MSLLNTSIQALDEYDSNEEDELESLQNTQASVKIHVPSVHLDLWKTKQDTVMEQRSLMYSNNEQKEEQSQVPQDLDYSAISEGDFQFDEAIRRLSQIFGETDRESKTLSVQEKSTAPALEELQFSFTRNPTPQRNVAITPASSVTSNVSKYTLSVATKASPAQDELAGLDSQTLQDLIKNKELNKNTLTLKQVENLVERLSTPLSERKAKKIAQLTEEKKIQEEYPCTFHPHIDKNSRKLASQTSSLLNRIHTILEERKNNIEKRKQKITAQINEAHTYSPEINQASKTIVRDVSTFAAWNEERQKKLELSKKAQEEQQEDLLKSCFKPYVCEKTKKIMKQKQGPKNVFERNYDFEFHRLNKLHQEIEKIVNDARTPSITSKAANLERSEPIGDRLYKQAMQSLAYKHKLIDEQFEKYYHTPSLEAIKHYDAADVTNTDLALSLQTETTKHDSNNLSGCIDSISHLDNESQQNEPTKNNAVNIQPEETENTCERALVSLQKYYAFLNRELQGNRSKHQPINSSQEAPSLLAVQDYNDLKQ